MPGAAYSVDVSPVAVRGRLLRVTSLRSSAGAAMIRRRPLRRRRCWTTFVSASTSKRLPWPSRSWSFCFSRHLAYFLSSPSIGLNASSGMPSSISAGVAPSRRVAVLDVGVEEAQRLARLQGLQPQRDLGQFDGHRVEVDAVDAAGDDLAQGGAYRVERSAPGCARGPPRRAWRCGGRRRPGSGRSRRPGRRRSAPAARGRSPRTGRARPPRWRPLAALLASSSTGSSAESSRQLDQRGRGVVGAGRLAVVAEPVRPVRRCGRPRCAWGPAPAGTRRSSRAPRRRGCGSRPAASGAAACRAPGRGGVRPSSR